ncbi:DUF547 domain-containing protein [Nonlabens mediterrranea]|uniref:DUF547 domain-containing protein n=1 Tax=Nonlabens mediterrranea TaxID=1419947 RepID=A0ABS0A9K3_9FLAO|nr:DUF547 domain-containing protein [Nonlabens mediterrranea]
MRKRVHIFITFLILLTSLMMSAQLDAFQQQSQFLLNSYVRDGLVDYKSLQENPKTITVLKQSLSKTKVTKLTAQELKAFLINAYNMSVIISITEHYPTSSVLDIDGFFDKIKHQIAGKSVTLNELEKNWLFKKYPDARLHFALVCGAISCPPLKDTIFKSQNIESKLEKVTKATLNNPKFLTIDMHEKSASVSKIFDWYRTDFKKDKSVINFINKYTDKTIPDGFSLEFKNYDWSLNQK